MPILSLLPPSTFLSLPRNSRQKTSPPPPPPPSSSQQPLKCSNGYSIAPHLNRLTNLIDSGDLHEAISALDLVTKQHQSAAAAFPTAPPVPRRDHGHDHNHHVILTLYSKILKSCIRLRNFHLGRLVHSNLDESKMALDSVILNSLISLYTKSGEIETAKSIFRNMGENRDLVSWSAMISCYANNYMELEAILTFIKMIELGEIYPNEYCFSAIIRACSNPEFFSIGEVVYGFVIKTGYFESNVCVGCALVDMFVKGGSDLDSACKVFDKIPDKNVVSWTLMITRLAQMGYSDNAVEMFLDMVLSGFVPDRFTFSGIISACAELELLSFGRQLHGLAVRSGFDLDVCVGCSLVDMYAKCVSDNSFEDSRKVFDQMPDHNVMSWTAVITGHVQSGGRDKEAIEVFYEMIHTHVVPNHFTFSSILKACGNLSDLYTGEQIYAHAMKLGLASVNCVGNSVISMYARAGKTEDARKAFDILFEKNLVSYNTMVAAYSKSSNSKEAFQMFNEIENTKLGVNSFTYASLLSGAASIGALGKGEQIHGRLLKTGFSSEMCTSNALISMYSKCGDINDAFQVFNVMDSQNVISWTSIITGFAKHGLATRALELFRQMIDAGLKPNEVTYVAVLSACSHAGLVSEGWKFFNSMIPEHGIVPRIEHYACMVDLLGRSGLLNEALEFINSIPVKSDALVWRTLLGACQVHGNTELGEYAAKMILECDPHDPSAYILLSNLYASTGKWENVVKIRKSMKERNLIKEAGCSWIEVENIVHKFHVGDTSHSQASEIYEKLDDLIRRIKKLGYVPDTNFVLHDVEHEQKEQYLFQHSEKIAVAFGLISMSKSKPIRIFKNLRVCGDCHNAIKYMSLDTGREIVLRDSNRFHHMKNGVCSCNEYW